MQEWELLALLRDKLAEGRMIQTDISRSAKIGQHQSECKWKIVVTDDTALFF
jgi:hypothetical protein